MAYPGEPEHKDYMDYVIEQQSKGEAALPKDEWRKKKKAEKDGSVVPTAMSEY
jgi:hypothetical protein